MGLNCPPHMTSIPMKNFFSAGIFALFLSFCKATLAVTPTLFVTQDTTWSGTISMTENVIVQSGNTLTIAAGTTVSMGRGISVTTESLARINMAGTIGQPISISPLVPGTYFNNFHSKDSSSFIEMNYVDVEGGQIKIERYWLPDIKTEKISENEAQEELIRLLKRSIELRLISEVPLGVFLSGGIDSSCIAALASQFSS